MKHNALVVMLCTALVACSRGGPSQDVELADAQAEADAATAVDFGRGVPPACGLLARTELQDAIGALTGEPESPPEDAADTADTRCVWRGADERMLVLSASGEGGTERISAIEPYTAVQIQGEWDQARLQGCCLLHAMKEEALLSLDFSSARITLEQAAKLMDLALLRLHEPLDTP